MNSSTRYSPEVRDRAVRLVLGGGEARSVPHVLPVGMAPRCACSSFLLRHVAGEPNNIIEVELKSVGVIRTALDVAADAMPFFGEARGPVQRYVQSTEIAPARAARGDGGQPAAGLHAGGGAGTDPHADPLRRARPVRGRRARLPSGRASCSTGVRAGSGRRAPGELHRPHRARPDAARAVADVQGPPPGTTGPGRFARHGGGAVRREICRR